MRPLRPGDVAGSYQEYLIAPHSEVGQEVLMDARARIMHFLSTMEGSLDQVLRGWHGPEGYRDALFLDDLRVVMEALK